jgi:hypothetical protein
MLKSKCLFTVALLTVIAAAMPAAYGAPTVHFLAAGSSAMFQGFEIATVNSIGPLAVAANAPGGSVHHYTFKSTCPGLCLSVLHDPRTNGTPPIPDEPSNVWVVWTCPPAGCTGSNAVDVWAYHQVDSTVGVRSILSRANSGVGSAVLSRLDAGTSGTGTVVADQAVDAVNPALLDNGVAKGSGSEAASCPVGGVACDDKYIPGDVWSAISGAAGAQINVGMTDIRPEDAKAATKRVAGPVSNNVSLGYGTVGSQLITSAILSAYSNTQAQGVEFGLPGLPDPFNNVPVPPSMTVIPVGQSPILFIANRGNAAGLGAPDTATGDPFAFTNLVDTGNNPLGQLFSGVNCSGSNPAFTDNSGNASLTASGLANFNVNLVIREPLSGTMNTTEWTSFRTAANNSPVGSATYLDATGYAHISGAAGGVSQEYNVKPTDNPLNKGCQTGGTRKRAIGTGELIKSGIKAAGDNLGYAFFSFGNVDPIKGPANKFGYLTIDGVDPIFVAYNGADTAQAAAGNFGGLPTCNPGVSCNKGSVWTAGVDFPNLRNGSYRAWSLLRAICDTADTHCTGDAFGANALIQQVQADISTNKPKSVADFLPYDDIKYVRSHYNLLGGTSHAQPFVHYFNQPMINPGTLSSPPNTLDVAQTALENGGDAGGCILPLNTAAPGSTGFNANDTVIKVTSVTLFNSTGTKYAYTDVSGTPLATLAGLGKPVKISITGFPTAGHNGVKSLVAGSVSGGQFKVTGNVGPLETITPPAAGNGAAGNGFNAAGAGVVQCNQ